MSPFLGYICTTISPLANLLKPLACRLLKLCIKGKRGKQWNVLTESISQGLREQDRCVNNSFDDDIFTHGYLNIELIWKLYSNSRAVSVTCAALECSFLGLRWKEQTSCLHGVAIRVKQTGKDKCRESGRKKGGDTWWIKQLINGRNEGKKKDKERTVNRRVLRHTNALKEEGQTCKTLTTDCLK